MRRPSTKMRWAQEVAITLLRRESPSDAPGCPPPSRLWSLSTHVVHQLLGRIHPHQPHRPRSCILHRNCNRWRVVVCMSISNSSIHCSIWKNLADYATLRDAMRANRDMRSTILPNPSQPVIGAGIRRVAGSTLTGDTTHPLPSSTPLPCIVPDHT